MYAIKGRILYCIGDPYFLPEKESYRYLPNGVIIIENGRIKEVIEDGTIPHYVSKIEEYDSNNIILPGFIDSHIHFPQMQIIGAYGKELLDWLSHYTFSAEQHYGNLEYASKAAKIFIDELLKNGITTAAVYCTVHSESVHAIFSEAGKYNLCIIAGQVMMSRNAPENLLKTPQKSFDEIQQLIKLYHNKDRLYYAVTPRFAITCPEEELELASALLKEREGLFLQTHLSENQDEVRQTLNLFPKRKNYTDIYDYYGLLGNRSLFGHAIHLSEEELLRLSETNSSIIHCPTSNLFLGSGFFNVGNAKRVSRPVEVGIASDIGAGTNFSPLVTLNEAYKTARVHKESISPIKALYLLTLGNARALRLENEIGSFKVGNYADIVVLNNKATDFLEYRQSFSKDILEELFVYITTGDDRNISSVYVCGKKVYCNN